MRVLIACEFSGIVREAFRARGHEAVSVDFLPSEQPGSHYQCDVLDFIRITPYAFDPLVVWDMMIAFPPCTHLAVSGARWFKNKQQEQREAIRFVERLWNAGIPRIAIENPVGVLSTRSILGRPSQTFQPHQFWAGEYGKGEVKRTCLWLKNLPKLVPTTPDEPGRHPACWFMPPSPDRWKNRSRTYQGIADAMAEQWQD